MSPFFVWLSQFGQRTWYILVVPQLCRLRAFYLSIPLLPLSWFKIFALRLVLMSSVVSDVLDRAIILKQEVLPSATLFYRLLMASASCCHTDLLIKGCQTFSPRDTLNPLNPELNPICYLLALLGIHHFLHVSRIRVKSLTFRRLMSYIHMEHPFLMFLDHTQRRSTVGRTPLDE